MNKKHHLVQKRVPKNMAFLKKFTFPHFLSPVLLSASCTLQIWQNKRKNSAKKCLKKCPTFNKQIFWKDFWLVKISSYSWAKFEAIPLFSALKLHWQFRNRWFSELTKNGFLAFLGAFALQLRRLFLTNSIILPFHKLCIEVGETAKL